MCILAPPKNPVMKRFKYAIPILIVALLAACHKDPPKTYDDTDITVTYYNTAFNFGSYNTFIMPDSMVLKTNYLEESGVEKIYKDGGASDQALELLKNKFLEMGYTEVDSIADADFIALPTLLMMKADETVWYGTGWWWGYPGYGWSWGFGFYLKNTNYYYGWYPVYPWYPTGVPVTVSTYTGTIVYEMLDVESYLEVIEWNIANPDPGPDDVSPVLEINWQAQIEGYTTDDASYDKERALNGTNEAFAQSPYLKK